MIWSSIDSSLALYYCQMWSRYFLILFWSSGVICLSLMNRFTMIRYLIWPTKILLKFLLGLSIFFDHLKHYLNVEGKKEHSKYHGNLRYLDFDWVHGSYISIGNCSQSGKRPIHGQHELVPLGHLVDGGKVPSFKVQPWLPFALIVLHGKNSCPEEDCSKYVYHKIHLDYQSQY